MDLDAALDALGDLDSLSVANTFGQAVQDVEDTTPAGPSIRDLQAIAIAALSAVARDPKSPAAARAQAARTLMEYTGALGRHAKPPGERSAKPLATMSRVELLAELAALRGDRSADMG